MGRALSAVADAVRMLREGTREGTAHFTNEFAESTEIRCAANLVDHILNLALNLDLPALKQRSALIAILEEYVLKDRAGLRAAVKSLIDEACDEAGVCMVALPSNFTSCSWDDIRSCLTELQLGYSSGGKGDERITNLMRLVDCLESGAPPKPLPGFIEMATAMAGGYCSSRITLDCRGRIDVRDTYIEFHIGAFKAATDGLPETCTALKRAAALFVWAYRVLEPHIHTHAAGRKERDVEAIGYAFMVGKVAPQDALLKLYDDFLVDVAGRRMPGEIAYRYFSVRPTGLHEHYAKS
ncbi:hypothetical protein HXX76_007855 [Chlamydomonas incerta]|uniref:Uncharacterized protein n=1 Tax=Chlamydomonas incerta TaxID=51695 RepID=A0A835W1T9_CHLIN|nr:hypothetical protein HXX76_007855 [Chlamydomonas incerta]|eukprot:KAG2434128.1 hypothetical protein HXX76_007855 [Chlamydomonas incerta]